MSNERDDLLMGYSISAFSTLTGLSTDTLRYYEKEKLIAPARDAHNRRIYSEEDRQWVIFILKLKATAMPLRELKRYAALSVAGKATAAQRMNMLLKHRKSILAQEERLRDSLSHLDYKIDLLRNQLDPVAGTTLEA
ncbi:MAG: MerR family transcriptional regulator [Sporolactobacillus sp.]